MPLATAALPEEDCCIQRCGDVTSKLKEDAAAAAAAAAPAVDEVPRPLRLAAAVEFAGGAHSMVRERPSTAARISNAFVRLSIQLWRDDVRALNSAL